MVKRATSFFIPVFRNVPSRLIPGVGLMDEEHVIVLLVRKVEDLFSNDHVST